MSLDDIEIAYKIWLKRDKENILGKGGAALLENIDRLGDIGKAAKELGYSYKYAWNIIQKIKRRFGEPPVETFKGGVGGGGGSKITDLGRRLINYYRTFESYITHALNNSDLWQSYGLKTTETNKISGTVVDIKKDDNVAILKIRIDAFSKIASIITKEAVEDLDLKKGKDVLAVIKSTEIQIGKEDIF
ncbi:MAG: TOBE domain-containing protein [Candidatus Helarchaeota archaeon]